VRVEIITKLLAFWSDQPKPERKLDFIADFYMRGEPIPRKAELDISTS
jgi:hypothetical protein